MRKTVLTVWICVMIFVGGYITFDYYGIGPKPAEMPSEAATEATAEQDMQAPPPAPSPPTPEEKPMTMNVKTPIASFDLTAYNSMGWAFVAKLLTLILVTYGGIRFINKRMT